MLLSFEGGVFFYHPAQTKNTRASHCFTCSFSISLLGATMLLCISRPVMITNFIGRYGDPEIIVINNVIFKWVIFSISFYIIYGILSLFLCSFCVFLCEASVILRVYLYWGWSWPPCSCCAGGWRRCIVRRAPGLSAGTPPCCSGWSACSPAPPYGSRPARGSHRSTDARSVRERRREKR